jgi:hypothetical protein
MSAEHKARVLIVDDYEPLRYLAGRDRGAIPLAR